MVNISKLSSRKKWQYLVCYLVKVSLFAFLFFVWSVPALAGYLQLDAVTDVKTRFSAGCSTVQELANLARHRGVDVVIYSDNDRRSLEYGIVPFESIFKKKKSQPSVLTSGAALYLAEINNNDQSFDDVLLIPAIETAPFYYWSGNLFKKNLTANNWGKNLMILGMDRPEDYEQLPILNSNFSNKYVHFFLKSALIYVGLFLVFLIIYFKKVARKTSFFLMIVTGLLAINNHPFKSSRFDAYHGDPGIEPYQEVIDYARSKEALVFWSHLDSTEDVGKFGTMELKTLPHPEDLILSHGYTGFQAVYDSKYQATELGKYWDRVLMDYVSGDRKQAVWGYGGNDFHCEGDKGNFFGGVRTIFLVREKNKKAILDAFKLGRMYSVKQSGKNRLSLDSFSIEDKKTQQLATLGESLSASDYPEIKIKLRSTEGAERPISLSIIRNGKLIKEEKGTLPYELNWRDMEVKRNGLIYYRIIAQIDPENYLVSNPIFVSFTGGVEQVARLPLDKKEKMQTLELPHVKSPKPPFSPKAPEEPKVGGIEVNPKLKKTIEYESKNNSQPNRLEKEVEISLPSPMRKLKPASFMKLSDVQETDELGSSNMQGPETPQIKEPSTPEEPKIVPLLSRTTDPSKQQPTKPKPVFEQKQAVSKTEKIAQESPVNNLKLPEASNMNYVDEKPAMSGKAQLGKTSSQSIVSSRKMSQFQPSQPKTSSSKTRSKTKPSNKRYVVALIDGVTLKKGPGVKFPEIATAKKGERLEFIRALTLMFDNKPWLEIERSGITAYVWGGLVEPE